MWEMVCKRTEDPKLAWIERQLAAQGIPCRRNGHSWHAPILEVPEAYLDRFWAWFQPYDDIDDDDPRFTKS